jgi:hypothetical protein
MMNVYENIAYGLRCAGASKDVIRTKVHDVLERISLPDVANAKSASFPAARSSASPLPAAWCSIPTCCCSTSRSARSISSCAKP